MVHKPIRLHDLLHAKPCVLLQVRWDEKSSNDRPERVSPWKIELASTPTLDPHPVCRPKRHRVNMTPSSTDSFVPTREGMEQLADMLHNSLFFPFFSL